MKKHIWIDEEISKSSYDQIRMLVGKEITPAQFIKDNYYNSLVQNVYRYYFTKLSDDSTLDDYVYAGSDIYKDLSALNKYFNIQFDGEFDEYLLTLIAGQIIYYFDESYLLKNEDTDSLIKRFKTDLSYVSSTSPIPFEDGFHNYLNNLIYLKEIENVSLVRESGLDSELVAALRSGEVKCTKDIAYIFAITLQLTRREAIKLITKLGYIGESEDSRDRLILDILNDLMQINNMPEHKGETGVEIVNILLSRKNLNILSNAATREEKIIKERTILITGANGFLGRNCVDFFTNLIGEKDNQTRYHVCVLSGKKFSDDSIFDKVTYYRGNVDDTLMFERILLENNVDYVIHLAAIPIAEEAKRNLGETININTRPIQEICDIILNNNIGIRGIIFPSTENVYEGSQGPLIENLILDDDNIENIYGYTKLMAERLARLYAKKGIPIVILRLCNIYGEQDHHIKDRLIPKTIHLLMQGKSPVLYVDKVTGQSERKDFLYVGDLVQAFEQLIQAFESEKEFNDKNIIYNLGSGEGYYIEEIQNIIMSIMKIKKVIEKSEKEITSREIMNVEKIKRDYNFSKQFSLEEGLQRTVKWYIDNREQLKGEK